MSDQHNNNARASAPASSPSLDELRSQINAVDDQLIRLLNERAGLSLAVGDYKAGRNEPVHRPFREESLLERLVRASTGPMREEQLRAVYREILAMSRQLQAPQRIACLGPAGTYSEQAALQQFGHAIEAMPCVSIDEVFRAAEAGTADFGVVPIENSTEGAINRTLDLLLQTPLIISGELSIPVHHSLMTKTGTMAGITRICAHSQALAQCQSWLNQHFPNIERQAVASNGEAAKMAADDPSVAAVASEQAGQKYNLQVVHAHIQDDPHNRTRFAVIGRLQTVPSGNDQTSLVLAVRNQAGAVYRMLEPLAKHGVSMTRFESRPARTGSWEYNFFIDIEGHAQDEKVAKALAELREHASYYKLLGSYPFTL